MATSSLHKRGPGRPRKIAQHPQDAAYLAVDAAQISQPESLLQGLLRLERIITGDPANGIEPLIPVSKTTIYQLVKEGKFPSPIRLPGVRGSFWRSAEVHAFIASAGGGQ